MTTGFWNVIDRIKPGWTLRLGLGLMYLYSGFDLFYKPEHWYGFVPQWFSRTFQTIFSVTFYLRMQGIGEIVLGLLFLAWFSGRRTVLIASALAVIEMGIILVVIGVDPITFRDIGLLGAAIALFVMQLQNHRGTTTGAGATTNRT